MSPILQFLWCPFLMRLQTLITSRYSIHPHLPLPLLLLILFMRCPLVRLLIYLLIVVILHSSIDSNAHYQKMLFLSAFTQILLSSSMILEIVSQRLSFHIGYHYPILWVLHSFEIAVDIQKIQIYDLLKPYLASILFMLHTQPYTSETQTKILLSWDFEIIHWLIKLE